MRLALAALALTAVATTAVAAPHHAPAPHVAAKTFNQLAQPLPKPYNEHADAARTVAAAKALAKREHKLLLIDMGGNWCLDCRLLAGAMDLPHMKPFIAHHYVVAMVDVGRFDKNLAIARHYGITKMEGVPEVLIVDPRTDHLRNAGHTAALDDARSLSPQALANWLASWT